MYKYRRIIVSAIAGLLIFSILAGFVVMAVNAAKTADELQEEIDELQGQSGKSSGYNLGPAFQTS